MDNLRDLAPDALRHALTLANYMAEVSDPWAFAAPIAPLCPDASVTPALLAGVIEGHGTSFLGSARPGEDFFRPRYCNYNHDAFVTTLGACGPEDTFKTIIFGEIASLPVSDWNHHSFTLTSPNWSLYGWDDEDLSALARLYRSQLMPIRSIYIDDHDGDLENERYPKVRNWTDGLSLIVDINSYTSTEYLVPDQAGDFRSVVRNTTFPFTVGDSVIMEATLHLWESEFSPTDHRRDYSIISHRIKFIKIKPRADLLPSPSQSLPVDTEMTIRS
ncbi:hypothetical protein B0H11DRAFT_2228643 [Mycena galericulata]|nr:hypothetical protein B0H11DRAFT_2228643 [Mycena galericulata]